MKKVNRHRLILFCLSLFATTIFFPSAVQAADMEDAAINKGNELLAEAAFLEENVNKGNLYGANYYYTLMSDSLKQTERLIGKVPGKNMRTNLQNKYISPAKKAKERIIYEISEYRLLVQVEDLLSNKSDQAFSQFKKLPGLKKRAADIKKSGGYKAVHPNIGEEIQQKEDSIQKQLTVLDLTNGIVAKLVKPGMSDLQKTLALHDYVVSSTAYDYDNYLKNTIPSDSYTPYGVLSKKTAVCQGYAETMELLLNKAGVETMMVTGTAGGNSHAWNKVKIEGVWYNLDATWDDPVPDAKKQVRYNYFLITDSQLAEDHEWDQSGFPKSVSKQFSYIYQLENAVKIDGYFYFRDEDHDFYKMDLNGKNKQAVSDKNVVTPCYGDGWIYFSNYSDLGHLYKMKLDGSSLTELKDEYAIDPYIEDGFLYYMDKDAKIVKISIR